MRSDGRCTSCQAPIRWAKHETTGRRMPLDVQPTPDGNVRVVAWEGDPWPLPVVVVGGAGEERAVTRYRYASHFATCPDAAAHRRRQ